MSTNPNYHSYLLRLWRDNAHQPWRASLQSTATGKTQVFANPQTLLAYLAEQVIVDDEIADDKIADQTLKEHDAPFDP